MEVEEASTSEKFDVAVVGVGYVGLPILLECIRAGMAAIGFDTNPDFFGGLPKKAKRATLGDYIVSRDPSVLKQASVIVICVPTPVTEELEPDLSSVVSAAETIAGQLTHGQLVILESTVAPGTTRTIVRSILERDTGLIAGVDFHLAYSPERIDPSNVRFVLHNTPKVIGGLTSNCAFAAQSFYNRIVSKTYLAKGLEEAEASKLLENIYRHVNIALINEFAIACKRLQIDVHDVIAAAESKPFGFQAFWPSVGAGGHCIPVDPNYFNQSLLDETGFGFRFVELANEINQSMPAFFLEVVERATEGLPQSKEVPSVLILGLSYKANVGDFRESRSVSLARLLDQRNLRVLHHDPHGSPASLDHVGFSVSTSALRKAIADSDIVLVLQAHREYIAMKDLFREFFGKVFSPFSPDVIPSISVFEHEPES